MPTMSPAKASSAVARSWAKKNCGVRMPIGLPVRTSLAFMPRVSLPEQTRRKAMRSRWFGSMFAWILKTKPVMAVSSGATTRPSAWRGCGQRVDQVAHAEVAQRAAKQDRRQVPLAERREIERPAGALGELDLLGRNGALGLRQIVGKGRGIDRR